MGSKNTKQTSEDIASLAGQTLQNDKSSQIAKELAASLLAQTRSQKETGKDMEEKASSVLKSKKYSDNTKKLAASLLAQSNKER